MKIIFHSHHANVSERMKKRAEADVRDVASRVARAVDAVIRFEQDGPVKRVEVALHAPRHRDLIAKAEGRYFGPALALALDRLEAQIRIDRKSTRTARRASSEKAARA